MNTRTTSIQSLTKMLTPYTREKKTFSTNGGGKTECPHLESKIGVESSSLHKN